MKLSKSQYVRGLQCHKALWLYQHRRELMAPVDAQKQALFDTGHEVGELAKQLFPGGVDIAFDADDFDGMIAQTADAIAAGADVIYEASFRARGVFVMADILVRDGAAWNLYEVKASSRTKPYHLHDVAIQYFVLRDTLPVARAHLVHVNSAYVLQGELDVNGLLAADDITDEVAALQPGIEANLEAFAAMLAGGEPDIAIGLHCNDPYECDFKAYCWREVPSPSVFDLYRLGAAAKFDLYHRGLVAYADLQDLELTPAQRLQVDSGLDGVPRADVRRLGEFLAQAEYPLNFLDFETLSGAVPRFQGQGPYRQLPFQYSLHVLHADGELEHKEFLADENADPRPELAQRLLADVTPTGTLVAFNQGFEKSVIQGLARQFPQDEAALLALNERFIDLLVPFRELMYYHPDFDGSFSIKSIVPALFPDDAELDYKNLEVQEGEAAMRTYASLAGIADPAERQRQRAALIEYCRLDTLAMVAIWRELESLAGRKPGS